jgi:soluble lytic murein transglycosylase-like protein
MNDALRMAGGVLALMAVCASAGSGQVLKYQDADGHIYYTDTPMRGEEYRLLWKSAPDPATTRFSMEEYWHNRAAFTPLIDSAAERVRLHPELLHAVVQAESAYDPDAYSTAGAVGLMQLMPATAERYGVGNSWNPRENVDGGARYLRDLMERFDQDLHLALAAYNAGEGAVAKYGNRIPPYPETQRYVEKVLANLERNRRQASAQPTIR